MNAIGWAITGPRNNAQLVLWSKEQGWTYRTRGERSELEELARDFADVRIGVDPLEAEVRAKTRTFSVRYDSELGYYGEAETRDGRTLRTNRQPEPKAVLRYFLNQLRGGISA